MPDNLDRRLRFIEHVTGLISDPTDSAFTAAFLLGVPSAFWSAPASSTGKYHPEYALGDGGLLRHTLVCIHVARDLARAYDLTSPEDLDIITIAAACHDTYKGGDTGTEPWTETAPDHGAIAADHMGDASLSYWANTAVAGHMSMWIPEMRFSYYVAPTPIWDMTWHSQVVSTADYIASRKYLLPSDELADLLAEYL